MKRLLSVLYTTDVVNISFFAILTVTLIVLREHISGWVHLCLLNFIVIVMVLMFAKLSSTKTHIWKLLHNFYMMICIPIAFKEIYYIVPVIHPVDYDISLMAIDFWMLGVNPTQWLQRISSPVLTEILQLTYSSFYLLPYILAIDLYRKKRMQAFKIVFLTVTFGFYLSYLGYVAVPAVGPRFFLHNFHAINEEIPGLFLTKYLRVYTDIAESIPPGTTDLIGKVQRDVFPSGHTQITLLVMFLAFRYRARTRWFLWVTGSLLVFSTVYLRYHYVIDVIGGALFAFLTMKLMWVLDSRWKVFRTRRVKHLHNV